LNGDRKMQQLNASSLACFLQQRIDLGTLHTVHFPDDSLEHYTSGNAKLRSYLSSKLGIHGRCAVVSNSGVLKRHKHGKKIDEADTVIRFNDAPIEGYDDMVGRKDNVRFVNMHFPAMILEGKFLDRRGVVYISALPPHKGKLSELLGKRPNMRLYMVEDEMSDIVYSTLHAVFAEDVFTKGSDGFREWPTSGAMGMLIALQLCDEVRAYGMATTERPDHAKYPYHYYADGGSALDNVVHKSFDAEKLLWRRLAKNPPFEIDETDVAVIPGLSQLCDQKGR